MIDMNDHSIPRILRLQGVSQHSILPTLKCARTEAITASGSITTARVPPTSSVRALTDGYEQRQPKGNRGGHLPPKITSNSPCDRARCRGTETTMLPALRLVRY